MRVRDPGHTYELQELDATDGISYRVLSFVKREGSGYPGNVGHHSGTNCQEVLRAVFDRIKYLDNQIPDKRNGEIKRLIRRAVWLLEFRAADRHGRKRPTENEAIANDTCEKCGHVGCTGPAPAGETQRRYCVCGKEIVLRENGSWEHRAGGCDEVRPQPQAPEERKS